MPTARILSSIPADCLTQVIAQLPDPRGESGPICVIEGQAGPSIGLARFYFQRQHGVTLPDWECYRIEPAAGEVLDVPF